MQKIKKKDHVYCDENAKQLFVAKCAGDSPTLLNAPNSRYIDVTMHVKEGEGHFEEGDAYTRTKTYYRGDSFDDNTEPEPEPEPEDEPAEESEAPEVPNTGANPTAENHTTAATYTGLGAVIALIAFAILHLLHKHRA